MQLLMTGDRIGAATALRYGLLNAVVPDDRLVDEARDLAERLLTRSGTALEVVKRSVLRLADLPQDAAFDAEARYGQQAFASDDAREGLAAFAARRPPAFPSRASLSG
jgi:enoyl-CoA hydratase